MQSGPADDLSVRDALFGQPVAVIVGVSAELDVSHASILLEDVITSQAAWPEVDSN
jgi:hypothetical protein